MKNINNNNIKSQSLHYYTLNKTLKKSNKRRSESVNKLSRTPMFETNDRESMLEEMSKLLKEIKRKTKQFKALSNSHCEIESDNYKLIQTIEGLIADCKQIPQPIEKNTTINPICLNKARSLENKYQDKLLLYQQELVDKDNYLNDLKSNDQKIQRMYEIEGKLIDANEQYSAIYLKYAELVTTIAKLDQQSQKVIEEIKVNKINKDKLNKEMNELSEKIKLNERENLELSHKEQFFDEKITLIKNKLIKLKSILKEKNETLKNMKEKMVSYQCLVSEKEKTDSMITNQIKQIQLLKDKSEKKSKQIKELDKCQEEYINKINYIKSLAKQSTNSLLAIQKEKEDKEKEYAELKQTHLLMKEKKQKLLERLMSTNQYEIQKQLSYSLNMPIEIELV